MLSISDLTSGYGDIEVLRQVSLSVGEGEIVTLIGANGAGKTTLVRTISGLIKARGGRIVFHDKEIQRLPPHKIVALGIIQCPEGRAVLARMSVAENLMMGAYARSDREIGDDIEKIFGRFPALRERRAQPASVLSGGEQQMLAIGRSLMARPRLLLMDEPSLGLAPMIVTEIFQVIKGLRDEGITIFLVEQNARRALEVADRGYVFERGRVVLEGTGAELANNPQVQKSYLGIRSEGDPGRAARTRILNASTPS
jgi:branched-chain amino acid transport system ATP-binding protein